MEMCRYYSKTDPGYIKVGYEIKSCVEEVRRERAGKPAVLRFTTKLTDSAARNAGKGV
jgi:hypothetical protein